MNALRCLGLLTAYVVSSVTSQTGNLNTGPSNDVLLERLLDLYEHSSSTSDSVQSPKSASLPTGNHVTSPGEGNSYNSGFAPSSQQGKRNSGSRNAGSPFSAAMGASKGSPFSAAAGGPAPSGSGDKENMAGPFSVGMSSGGHDNAGQGAGPFNAKEGSGMGSGIDIASLMSSGPGGLTGGSFFSGINATALMGVDFSKQISSQGHSDNAGMSNVGTSPFSVDSARFDTSAYQNMLKDMFNADQVGQELTDMGNPFDGKGFDLPTDKQSENTHHYDTSRDASLGSYAATDMSAYSSDSRGGLSWNQDVDTHKDLSSSYGNSNSAEVSENGGSPFDVHNYGTNGGSSSNNNKMESPFDTSNFNKFQSHAGGHKNGMSMNMGNKVNENSPFTVTNSNSMFSSNSGTGTASGPFDASKFYNLGSNGGQSPFSINKQSTSVQNPFDTSNFYRQTNQNGMGNSQYTQSYGNNDFERLSGFSSNDAGTSMGTFRYSSGGNTNTDNLNSFSNMGSGSQNYNGYSDNLSSMQHSDNTGSGFYRDDNDASGSPYDTTKSLYSSSGYIGVSESQYKTPFESDNYNELIENPFDSESYFDSNRQNFQLPYEKTDTALQAGSGPSQKINHASGPAGDPFNQGGNSMG